MYNVAWWLPSPASSANRCPAAEMRSAVYVGYGFSAPAGGQPCRMDVIHRACESGGDMVGSDENARQWWFATSRQLGREERTAAVIQGNNLSTLLRPKAAVKWTVSKRTQKIQITSWEIYSSTKQWKIQITHIKHLQKCFSRRRPPVSKTLLYGLCNKNVLHVTTSKTFFCKCFANVLFYV